MSEKKKILIIDDDKFLLDMYAMKFGKSDFEVRTASAARWHLIYSKMDTNRTFCLWILVMPGMDGFCNL